MNPHQAVIDRGQVYPAAHRHDSGEVRLQQFDNALHAIGQDTFDVSKLYNFEVAKATASLNPVRYLAGSVDASASTAGSFTTAGVSSGALASALCSLLTSLDGSGSAAVSGSGSGTGSGA